MRLMTARVLHFRTGDTGCQEQKYDGFTLAQGPCLKMGNSLAQVCDDVDEITVRDGVP